jgi:hypothetical protein
MLPPERHHATKNSFHVRQYLIGKSNEIHSGGADPQSLATISAAGDEKYNFTLLPGQARRLFAK